MSAADWAAFSNNPGLDPGTASSERCRRGVACSMIVKLMPLFLSLRFSLPFVRGPVQPVAPRPLAMQLIDSSRFDL